MTNRWWSACLTLCLALPLAPAPAAETADDGWISLFNGVDLTGWTPKIRGQEAGQDKLHTFRVEDGVIKVRFDEYEKFDNQFGHLFYNVPFSNYRLKLEYRFVGEQCPGGPGWALRNSGIMIHGQSPQSMGVNQNFPVSIEVQLLGGDGRNPRSTMNLCTPGTNVVLDGKLHTPHCTNSRSETYHGEQWVAVEVEVHGHGKIKHYVGDQLVFEYEQPQLDPNDGDAKKLIEAAGGDLKLTGGTISLQSESHPCEFRNIRLKKLAE